MKPSRSLCIASSPFSSGTMLRLPTLLPFKPSTPTAGLNPTRCSHGHRPKRLLASSTPPPPSPTPPRTPNPTTTPEPLKPEARTSRQNPEGAAADFPTTKPRKPRRGRRGETAAVEDFVRGRLEQVFASIRERDPEVFQGKGDILKRKEGEEEEQFSDEEEREELGEEEGGQKAVVVEEDPNWPLDADVGWGIRASEYFDKHSIKNVTVDGVEIDWEGEVDESWVKEINCLEWESFAFHPSPLVVLVFERYNRSADNWKFLQELEKAAKVYWNTKDRLPPRTVKIDMNIERDLAYALQVKECPQLLFFRGNKILYREKEIRTADELVQMIAHFYYNAKSPSCVNPEAVAHPF